MKSNNRKSEKMSLLCPLDDRYAHMVEDLPSNKSRVMKQLHLEFMWANHVLEFFNEEPVTTEFKINEELYETFEKHEKRTRHDVKAMEITIAEKYFPSKEWAVHWGLTSEDINGLGNAFMLNKCRDACLDELNSCLELLIIVAVKCTAQIPGRTHGQMAVPTSFKERFMVYSEEIMRLRKTLEEPVPVKFGGAIGNFDEAITAIEVYKNCSRTQAMLYMQSLVDSFFENFPGFVRVRGFQTQLYTQLGEHLSKWNILCTFLLKVGRDMWDAFSRGYFYLETDGNRVGSSVMSQKINPANTENAMGNWKIARMWFNMMTNELPLFMHERDIVDSTILRNIPVMFGHFLVGLKSWGRDLREMRPTDFQGIEVEENGQIYIARVQTYLRLTQIPDAYERTRQMTQGRKLTKEQLLDELIETFPEIDSVVFTKLLK